MMHAVPRPRSTGLLALAAVVAAVLVATVQPVAAAESVSIEAVELLPDGTSSLVFRAPPSAGPVTAGDITLTEDGAVVTGFDLESIAEPDDRDPLRLAIAMDISGSTEGEAIAAARTAASAMVAQVVDRGVEVLLLSFADTATILAGPTTDVAELQAAIAGLEAGGDTALNDAVLLAAQELFALPGEDRILVFTDGVDEGSQASLATVVDALAVAEIPTSSIVLETGTTDLAALQQLADAAGGSVESVAAVGDLASAFERAALDLPSLYLVTWSSRLRNSSELTLSLGVTSGEGLLSDTALVRNPRRGVPTTPNVVRPHDAGIFAAGGGVLAFTLFGIGLAALLAMMLVPGSERNTRLTLAAARGDRPSNQTRDRDDKDQDDEEETALLVRLREQAARAVELVPAPSTYDDDLELRLERAGWSLRPAEYQVVRLATTGLFLVMGFGLRQNLLLAIAAGALGFYVPSVLMARSHRRRQSAFVDQLPDVLQLIAGSLKAGYGLVQAIDLVVEESQPPISDEFGRVVSEHLLGLELEDALMALADRIDTEDLRWVVVAMNVQRKVGGNLAELLETVAKTLRERAMVKRHVRALSAEGRLSARVLTIMPFFIGGYVGMINPDYIATLFTDPRGRVMLSVAGALMVIGTFWMRKLIDVDV